MKFIVNSQTSTAFLSTNAPFFFHRYAVKTAIHAHETDRERDLMQFPTKNLHRPSIESHWCFLVPAAKRARDRKDREYLYLFHMCASVYSTQLHTYTRHIVLDLHSTPEINLLSNNLSDLYTIESSIV